MSDPSNLTSPNPVIDTRPERKGALLPSVQDYYERYRNPNLFICNNANPFLISPYAPNQISQTTKNAILATDVLRPYTPNKTIAVEGNVQMADGYNFYVGTNQPLFNNRIYANTWPDPPAAAVCQIDPLLGPTFTVGLGVTQLQCLITSNDTTFSSDVVGLPGTYSVFVDGNLSTITQHYTTPAVSTPISFQNAFALLPASPPPAAPAGYIPITVAGATRYVPYYA